MSLRVFHVIFIIICIALCLYVSVWGIREYMATRSVAALVMTAVFVTGGVLLVGYSGKAFRKLKDL
jgi:Na+/proline symporter